MRALRFVIALLAALSLFALATAPVAAGAPSKKALDPKSSGEVFEWTSAGGTTCFWRGPEKYDATTGVNLTVILHGSNLTHEWGFANHDSKTFRTDDFVLVPDGTTGNGKGGFNFLPSDVKAFDTLLAEVRKAVKVRAVFLYGHSQGSFFALLYAGARPTDVTGVVAHASGAWAETAIGPAGHGQAIVLMHGTQDPVVPYAQSAGSFESYVDAGYPMVRLRSLEGWNHWPAEHNGEVRHTSQQLAWVEGMTTKDAARLTASFDTLATVSADGVGEHDFAGLWSLASRIAELDDAPPALKTRAAKAKASVEALAVKQVTALALPEKLAYDGKPWVAQLPLFLRQFAGVPAREELAKKLAPVLDAHKKDGIAHLRKHYAAAKRGKSDEAFEEGVAAIESGFLWCECADHAFRESLATLQKDAKKLKLSKAALKTFGVYCPDYDKTFAAAWKSYESVNRTFER